MPDESVTHPDRTRDFVERYANNVRFESTFWDLKILLGVYDQSVPRPNFFVHTAMHLPWAQAKLVAYYLYMNTLFHEASSGEIPIPAGMIPDKLQLPETMKDDPKAQALVERLERLRNDLFRVESVERGKTQEG